MGLFSGIGKALGGIAKTVLGTGTGIFGTSLSGGDLFSSALGLLGGYNANAANKDMASQQMAFQQYNSDTAYQRSVKDMKAAGLNPIMAATQGGASTPSGSTATMENLTNSAASLSRNRAEIAAMKSSTDLNKAATISQMADAKLKNNSAKVAEQNAKNLAQQLPGLMQEAKIDQSSFGRAMRWLGRLNPLTSNAKDAAAITSLIK